MLVVLSSIWAGGQGGGVAAPGQAPGGVGTLGLEAKGAPAEITDEQRGALTITSYDLQVHLSAGESRLSGVARLVVRNDGARALPKLPLQLSSMLHWEAATGRWGQGEARRLGLEQHRIDTDTDHTGAANEAILALPAALQPGGSVELVLAYSGTVERSAARLTRAGEGVDAAAVADWDGISADEIALRGFGNVLWYPVAAPQAFLEDGAQLANVIAAQRRREREARVRLRLEMEGGSPAAGYFCGREAKFAVVNGGMARGGEADTTELPAVSTAEWPAARLGFGPLSLFVVGQVPESGGGPVAVTGATGEEARRVEGAAGTALPLVREWLGEARERQPVLLAHTGEPFAQRALLVEGAREAAGSFPMTHLLSHAWISSPEVWLDEGVAQFLPLVALEQTEGRAAALAQLHDLQPALSLADAGGGEPLTEASREVFFRNKAVSVLWMLRSLAGDAAMQRALQGLKHRPEAERTAEVFEGLLESASGKDLRWFFRDWVLADRGLPDLSIAAANVRAFSGVGGRGDGNLVAVEVRNDGQAEAEVPVTVRSGELTSTERLRVPARGTAAVRILFQGAPEVVEVNDGTVPEVAGSSHELSLAGRASGPARR